jgi:hypothetical protein
MSEPPLITRKATVKSSDGTAASNSIVSGQAAPFPKRMQLDLSSASLRVPSSSGTENSAKAFSFLNTSDFLTVAVIPALLATPSAALGDSASLAPVTARPTHGDDVLEDHRGSILCAGAGHSAPG